MSDANDRAHVTYPADFVPPMDEARARKLINGADWNDRNGGDYLPGRPWQLDGHFTADELEAFAWWLRNKPGEEP